MGIIISILIFGFIVTFHEMGHFILAKLNGIEVEEFCLGFGPTLLGKTIKGTKFSWRLLPFGGACIMGEDEAENLRENSFNNKSVWARISVVAAGPIFNFILALILSIILVMTIGYDEPVLGEVMEGYSAQEQGLREGDRILKMDGKRIHLWKEISMYNLLHQGESISVVYERDGKQYEATLTPKQDEDGSYYYGLVGTGQRTKANLLTAIQYGHYTVQYMIRYAIGSLELLLKGNVGLKDMSGPVGMVNIMDKTYKASAADGAGIVALNFLNIAILLSANLGVMNLLPLPALDGGRLVFLLLEVIRRKRIPPEKEGYVHLAGMVLLMALMVLIMISDVKKLF